MGLDWEGPYRKRIGLAVADGSRMGTIGSLGGEAEWTGSSGADGKRTGTIGSLGSGAKQDVRVLGRTLVVLFCYKIDMYTHDRSSK